MADPTPSVKLPEAEYVELYNKSTLSVDLKDWTLELGSSKKIFPRLIIPARGYVILCDDSTYNSLKTYGPAIGFSSFIVTNTGSTITLKDQNGNIIHTVNYTDGWYKSNYKKDGGWSLELIDPSNPCGESSNWKASEDESGGTPGKKNSVYASNPDLTAPVISRVGVQDNLNIRLTHPRFCYRLPLHQLQGWLR